MIKIFETEQIKEADQYTIKHEPISSIQLMERAANAFVFEFLKDFPNKNIPVSIFCGNGNNGGDGLAIARILLSKKYKVDIFIFYAVKYSIDFTKNLSHLQKKNKKQIHYIENSNFIEKLPINSIIIDCIFGTGLTQSIKQDSIHYQIIEKINDKKFYKVVSVDIPSGLFSDKHTNGIAVKSCKTYTFQFPKLSFLMPENENYVSDFNILNIGLNIGYISKTKTKLYFIDTVSIQKKLHQRNKYAHKGTYGHANIIAGSYGKIGAAVLSSKACLRTGCGLVTVHIPSCGYEILQTLFPESMCNADKNTKYISSIPADDQYDAVAIGPGIGMHALTRKAFELFLKKYKKPYILDADALNILSKKKSLLKIIPLNSILTPHPKEFERLAGKWKNDFERLTLQQNFSKKFKVIIVLKGAHTSISDVNGDVYFNSTGNPGMATAGSGDVLTGIITGFLAQQYSPLDSAILGVYIHGLAGDKSLETQSMESMIASDIITNLGNAFKEI